MNMKPNTILRFSPFIFLSFLLVLFTAFRPEPSVVSHTDQGRALYLKGIDSLTVAVEEFNKALADLDKDSESFRRASAAFVNARLQFKRIEFLVGYFDSHAENRLNGAPLEKVNESDLQRSIISPEGFQVIE